MLTISKLFIVPLPPLQSLIAQVYPVLAKLKGEGRPFWSGQANTYPLNLYLLLVRVMLTIVKMFIILAKLKGRGMSFLEGVRREATL